MDGTYAVGILLVILGGIALAVQSGVNATLAKSVESRSFAAAVSFTLGFLICLAFFLIDSFGLRSSLPSAASIRAAPWWSWVGGVLGAYYVVVVIIFAQKLGAGTIVAIFVTSQLLTSVILDLTGLVGFSKRVFSWPRMLGAALMIMGVVLVTYFPGEPVAAVQKRLLLQQQQQQQQQQQPLDEASFAAALDISSSGSSGSSSSSLQQQVQMLQLAAAEAGAGALLMESGDVDVTATAQERSSADAIVKLL